VNPWNLSKREVVATLGIAFSRGLVVCSDILFLNLSFHLFVFCLKVFRLTLGFIEFHSVTGAVSRTAEEFAAGHVEGSVNIPYLVKMGPGTCLHYSPMHIRVFPSQISVTNNLFIPLLLLLLLLVCTTKILYSHHMDLQSGMCVVYELKRIFRILTAFLSKIFLSPVGFTSGMCFNVFHRLLCFLPVSFSLRI